MYNEEELDMLKNNIKTYIFMFLITLVSSLLLSFSYSSLKSYTDANKKFDIRRNIIKSVGIDIKQMNKDDIINDYSSNVDEIILDYSFNQVDGITYDDLESVEDKKTGTTYYVSRNDKNTFSTLENKKDDKSIKKFLPVFYHNVLEVFVFPISGKGLWSTLFGFLALDKDKNTVKGITFYKHAETPGLGGEVDKKWFQDNFVGKKIFNMTNELVSVQVLKGSSKALPVNDQVHAVDGITGATITSKGLSDFLLYDLKRYEQFLKE